MVSYDSNILICTYLTTIESPKTHLNNVDYRYIEEILVENECTLYFFSESSLHRYRQLFVSGCKALSLSTTFTPRSTRRVIRDQVMMKNGDCSDLSTLEARRI